MDVGLQWNKRMSVIWNSLLSDYNEALASNQFALPVLQCLMWTQVQTIVDLLQLDVEVSKVITQSGGKDSLGSTELMYLPNKLEERDLKSVEEEYILNQIKAAIKNPCIQTS